MISTEFHRKFYPDKSHCGTRAFYKWVRDGITPQTILLNLGAGPPTKDPIRVFKGEVRRVCGADIDPIVLSNEELDEAKVIEQGRLPYADEMFDVVVSDYTLEHVDNPLQFLQESRRVLKKGGSLYFRTPNLRHYVAAISYLTPQWFHLLIANRARGLSAAAHDPWPTRYRMNTPRALHRLKSDAGFDDLEIRFFEGEPSYLVFNSMAFLMGVSYERLVNRFGFLAGFRSNLFGRFRS